MCYEVRIPDVDDHDKFVIVCTNFKVTRTPQVPFDDEVEQENQPNDADANIRGSHTEEHNIATTNNHGTTSEDIAELRAQGIEVDDKGPAPKNIAKPKVITPEIGEWEDVRTCPRKQIQMKQMSKESLFPRHGHKLQAWMSFLSSSYASQRNMSSRF